jgi:hypothetical protein
VYQELLEKRRVKKEALAEEVSFRSSLLVHLIYIYARSVKKVAGAGQEFELVGNRTSESQLARR